MILISGCLLGINCRYDGSHSLKPELLKLIKEGRAIPICPEQLGGAPTPRIPCEIVGGNGLDVLGGGAKVINNLGEDTTEFFIKGAREVLKIAEASGAGEAILKERSPSCGVKEIYDGSFSGKTVCGIGVTAAMLKNSGIELWTEENHPYC